MSERFALVVEYTVECEAGLYKFIGEPCLSGGKYAILDLDDPISDGPQKFMCVAHLCPEHALIVLKQAGR